MASGTRIAPSIAPPLLTGRRCNALLDIVGRTPGLGCQGKLGCFLDRYLVAEALAIRLQSYYQADAGLASTDKVLVNQLLAAQRNFAFIFDDLRTKEIFLGGTGTCGSKTCRQLRNGYVHSLSNADRREIEARSTPLLAALTDYIDAYTRHCS